MEDELSRSTILKNMMSLIISLISAHFLLAMITLYKIYTGQRNLNL